jgi:hypothetical protein
LASGDNNRWGISSHYLYKDNGMSINWVRLVNPRIVNEVSLGLRHDSEGFVPSDGEIDRLTRSALKYTAPQLFSGNNTLGTIPARDQLGRSVANDGGQHQLARPLGRGRRRLHAPNHLRQHHLQPARITITRRASTSSAFATVKRPVGIGRAHTTFSSNDSNFTAAQGNTGHPYAQRVHGSFRSYSESSSRPHTDLERLLMQWYVQISGRRTGG